MPNYADGVNRLRIAELEARATNFADNYKRGRYSIIFISILITQAGSLQ
jgi:hypothetical protein